MKPNLPISYALTCLFLASMAPACAAEPGVVVPDATPRSADLEAQVCDPSHQVAVLPQDSVCTTATLGLWASEPVFGGGPGPVAAGLRPYCRYTFDGDAKTSDVGDLAAALPSGTELGVDCRVVETQNSAIADEVGDELEDYFGWLSGRITPQEIGAVPVADIHTAIVDTYPSNAPIAPVSTHGPVVASIVESFLCPTGSGCTHQVRNYLGLPRTNEGINPQGKGGQVGLQSDLARGIYHALAADEQLESDHLVINLSVAWEAEKFGGTGIGDMDPAARSVYDVIRVARCRRALIIAAAGNQSGLSCSGEPMAPARWEDIAAPDSLECEELGITNPYVDPATDAPLVHAVGGLLGPNVPMATSRAAGMPRLAAASSHAVASPRDGLASFAVRTGSSIGTAVASASASLVWGYNPGLSPSTVMQKLYDSGHPVGTLDADFGPWGVTPVHRIDACAAVALAAPGLGVTCGGSPPVTINDIVVEVEGAVNATHLVTTDPGISCTDVCDNDYTFHPVPGSALGCEDVEPDPWRWLTSPQPTEAGCDECILTTESSSNEATAVLTVADYFDSDDIKSVEIEVKTISGAVHLFGITDKELQVGAVVQPRTGFVDEFVVPVSLGAVVPESAYVLMSFEDPNGGESIDTRDALILRSN